MPELDIIRIPLPRNTLTASSIYPLIEHSRYLRIILFEAATVEGYSIILVVTPYLSVHIKNKFFDGQVSIHSDPVADLI